MLTSSRIPALKKRAAVLLGLALVCLVASHAASGSGSFVTTRGRDILGPDGAPLHLRGIGLGNWLVPEGYMFHFERAVAPREIGDVVDELLGPDEARRFWERWTDSYVTREDILYLKRLGFNSIRVPFHHRMFAPEKHPDIVLESGFVPLDRVVGWAREAGLWVVLDMHAAPGGQTGDNIDDSRGYPYVYESAESQRQTLEMWRRIADHYKNEPAVLGYELLNEPIATFLDTRRLNPRLEPLYRRITEAIRTVDRSHLVILGGAQWDTNFTVFGPSFDPGVVYTFHRYWADPSPRGIGEYLKFRDERDVPVWMSESGENTDAWIATFRGTLEANHVGWCFWPYKKMDATSCVVGFARPPHWAEVIRYADRLKGGTFEEKRKGRPSRRHALEAFEGLLRNIRFEHCTPNRGYIQALGLTPP